MPQIRSTTKVALVEGLHLGELLDAAVVVADVDIDIDDLLAFHRQAEKLRLFLERMVRSDGDNGSWHQTPLSRIASGSHSR